jgi:basic membrane protein A
LTSETSGLSRRTLRRRAFIPLLVGSILATVAGCAQKENTSSASGTPDGGATPAATSQASPPPAPEGTMKVALVTPSKISDKGWGASAWAGVQKIKSELGAEVAPAVEGPSLAQVEGILRNLAQDGNNVIFLHGSEWDDAAKKVAPDFPKTTFVVMNGRSSGPNLTPIQFEAGQSTYLAGMVAAGMTKTGKLGLVGPNEIPIIKQVFSSFEKGAKAVKPDVTVTTTWTGDDTDVSKGKQQAQALLGNGVDVIMHNANAAGAGVFQAVMEKDGAMVIGANADQSDQATPKNIGSFILDVPSAMLAVGKAVKEGKVEGKPFAVGLKDKAVAFKFNPGFKGTIPSDLKTKLEAAEKDMIDGKLDPKPEGEAAP